MGVSEAIGRTLSELGEMVDVTPMHDVKDISPYKAVIAGSAIQASKCLPEAMDFIQTHEHDLKQKPFAVFLVCLTLAMTKGESYRDNVSSWLEPVRKLVTPITEGLFSGIHDIKKISSISDRLKFRISVMIGVWKEGDQGDWNAIQIWTKNLKSILDKE
jgi:menaquinone-dependent protoporphyrinogen oxidase